jgi:hypothetical protein
MLTIIICLLYCQGKKLTFRLEIMPIDAKKLTKSGNLDNCLQFLKKPVNLKGLRREKRYLCGRILRNGDEITFPGRRMDLGQICSISNHKS